MKVTENYLVLPIDPDIPANDAVFAADGVPQFDLPLPLIEKGGKRAFVDVRRFRGCDMTVTVLQTGQSITAEQADERPISDWYAAPDRQLAHFTPPFGHMNDPNGLCLYEGKYHAFYQSYPVSPRVSRNSLWYRQHWGHAVSDNGYDWTVLPSALLPSAEGGAWSGSAFIDSRNVTGLKENEHDPLLLYYTSCGKSTVVSPEKPFCQRMAYSTDGGITFRDYGEVVGNIVADKTLDPQIYWNRDPKVVYAEEIGKYVMALFLGDDSYELLTSDDLLHFSRLQNFKVEGEAECPDLFPVTASDGRRLWVFTGASRRYLVGNVTAKGFEPIQPVKRLRPLSESYAGQTFFGLSEPIAVEWLRVPYNNQTDYAGGFTALCRYGLVSTADGYVLTAQPLESALPVAESKTFLPKEFCLSCPPQPHYITVDCACKKGLKLCLQAFGVTVTADADKNELLIGDLSAKLRLANEPRIRFTVLFDRRSAEVFTAQNTDGFAVCEVCRLGDGIKFGANRDTEGTVTVSRLSCAVFTGE